MTASLYHDAVSCPACKTVVQFSFSVCEVCICTQCGTPVLRSGRSAGEKIEKPDADLCRLKVGTRGTWSAKKFVITGRLRMLFGDNGYVNFWHLEVNGSQSGWIAESYHTYTILFPEKPDGILSRLLTLKTGQEIVIDAKKYYLASNETRTDLQGEGEFSLQPLAIKMMYVIVTSPAGDTMHFHILNKKECEMFSGKNVDYTTLHLQNTVY